MEIVGRAADVDRGGVDLCVYFGGHVDCMVVLVLMLVRLVLWCGATIFKLPTLLAS